MTELLRSPWPCGAWLWGPETIAITPDGQIELAARLTAITARHGLMTPSKLWARWEQDHRAISGATSEVPVATNDCGVMNAAAVARAVHASRPDTLNEQAELGRVEVVGAGWWLDATAARRPLDDSAKLRIRLTGPTSYDIWIKLSVFHDVWMPYTFDARPHPEIHTANAPRLTAVLEEFEALLGPAEPADATSFGAAVGLTVENAGMGDGEPLDVTDMIPR